MAVWTVAAALATFTLLGLLASWGLKSGGSMAAMDIRAALRASVASASVVTDAVRSRDGPCPHQAEEAPAAVRGRQGDNVTGSGSTNVADSLNGMIARSTGKVYTAGKGVLIRNILDGFQDDTEVLVVPSTFWSNDIYAPSQVYPVGNPMQPSWLGNADNWKMPVVAVVIGEQMYKFFDHFDSIQDDHWGYGVFYPADSNSVDQRCRWIDTMSFWECPGGSILGNGQWRPDASKKGAGRYAPGNPSVYGLAGGGGAGCHFDKKTSRIDQINGKVGTDWNLVQDQHCQCNYKFSHNFQPDGSHSDSTVQNGWDGWVDDFTNYGLKGKAGPSWQMDLGTCWVNNPRDMIFMQNRLYWQRRQWLDGSVPYYDAGEGSPDARRRYWGWNEVPVSRSAYADMTNWDAVVIVLPAFLCSQQPHCVDTPDCMTDEQKGSLQYQIDQHVGRGALKPGVQHIRERPGSYMLFVRQVIDDAGNWRREFFCQDLYFWKYKVVYVAPSQQSPTGACYLDWA